MYLGGVVRDAYDIVTIHEAPDEQAALATLFAVESAGNATVETLNA
jgi:uncharacterized protein with GYD domain